MPYLSNSLCEYVFVMHRSPESPFGIGVTCQPSLACHSCSTPILCTSVGTLFQVAQLKGRRSVWYRHRDLQASGPASMHPRSKGEHVQEVTGQWRWRYVIIAAADLSHPLTIVADTTSSITAFTLWWFVLWKIGSSQGLGIFRHSAFYVWLSVS